MVRSFSTLFLAVAVTETPPFLVNEKSGGVDLKVVVFGSDAEVVKAEFVRLHSSFPFETKTKLEAISAPNVPQSGASLYFQVILPSLPPIEGRQVRLDVVAGTAPISGPYSAQHALHLRQVACIVLLPGDEAEVSQRLAGLLERAEVSLQATIMIAVASKDRQHSYPEKWGVSVAPSTVEAIQKCSVELHRRLVRAKTVPPKR